MTETDICNLALGRICAERIMALDGSTEAARYCALFFPQVRDGLLEEFAWTFAAKRAVLSRLATGPEFGPAYAYQLPNDFLQMRQLNGWTGGQFGQFVIEGATMLTDAEEAKILYTAQVTETPVWSPLFVDAFVLQLAIRLCLPITGSRTQQEALVREYENHVLPKARRLDAAENRTAITPLYVESTFVNSRFGEAL